MWIKVVTNGWTYAVIMTVLFGVQVLKNANLEAQQARDAEQAALRLSDSVANARQQERSYAQQYVDAVSRLSKDNEELNREKDELLASLRSANVRLRTRFSCPTANVPQASGTSGNSDGAERRGLLVEDAEFLVRLAAEADARVNQLTACQALLKDQTK